MKFKSNFLDNTNSAGIIYVSNFWVTLEMSLINCDINLILTWSGKCVSSEGNRAITFAMTDTKCYVPATTKMGIQAEN